MRPSPTITTLSDALTEILAPGQFHTILSANAVRTVLQTLWPETFCKPRLMPEWDLHFGERVYRDAVRAPVMWNYPPEPARSLSSSFQTISTRPADSYDQLLESSATHDPSGLPMLCYLGRSQLAAIRRNLYRVATGPSKLPNEPIVRLQQLRAKKLVPANVDHDAHFVGIFLAMAQRHFYAQSNSSRKGPQRTPVLDRPKRPQFHDVKLRLLTHDSESADFIIYTAYVTAQFLERFHDPTKVPDGFGDDTRSDGMRIEYTKIPIWPILGLRERMGKALGHDLVGVVEETRIETWQPVEDVLPKTPSNKGKRKRDALAEVVNSSFEDDCDQEQSLSGKKQRIREEPPVGVVV